MSIKSQIIPTVIERDKHGLSGVYDIYSRLLEDRIIFLSSFSFLKESSLTTFLFENCLTDQ